MELSEQVKIALQETRILILGAQVLLGFGFRGVFSERFAELPQHARYVDGVALGIGLFVGIEATFDDSPASIAAGAVGAGLALSFWYGLPQLRRRFVGERE